MKTRIKEIRLKNGQVVFQPDLRKYGAIPARPQFFTKQEAENAIADAIKNRGHGLAAGRREVTFGEQAARYFAAASTGPRAIAEPTRRSYQSMLDNHILPTLGHRRIIDIRPPQVMDFLTALAGAKQKHAEHDPRSQKNIGARTCALVRCTMNLVFRSAVTQRIISQNPMRDLSSGAQTRNAKVEREVAVEKERPFTQDQQDDLLAWCRGNDAELGVFIFIALRTGARPGELRALKWSDINGRKLLIERSASLENVITRPKTGRTRAVDLTPAALQTLREWKLKKGSPPVGAYIFGSGEEPVSYSILGKRLERAMRKCGVTGHSLYDTRHSFASVLLAKCRDVVYVSRMLGHSKPAMTLNIYCHWIETADEPYVNLLDQPGDKVGLDKMLNAQPGESSLQIGISA